MERDSFFCCCSCLFDTLIIFLGLASRIRDPNFLSSAIARSLYQNRKMIDFFFLLVLLLLHVLFIFEKKTGESIERSQNKKKLL
jgi:hypothetical protein